MNSFKKIIRFIMIAFLIINSFVFTQENNQENNQEENKESNKINVSSRGREEIVTEAVFDFENANRWFGQMYIDDGLVRVAKKKGAPKKLRIDNPDGTKFVLGAKVNFFKRKFSEIFIKPPIEVPIKGFVKKISIWAVGVNLPHTVYAVIRDFEGKMFELKFSPDLNFYGWKKIELNIPSSQKETNVVQNFIPNQKFYHKRGITFLGLKVKFYAFDAIGETYFYFDQLEVENDIYLEKFEREQDNLPEDEREIPLNNW